MKKLCQCARSFSTLLLLCFLLSACAAVPKEDPLSYQIYPIAAKVHMSFAGVERDADLTVSGADNGSITLLTSEGKEEYVLTWQNGKVTVCCGDQSFEIRDDPMLIPPLREIVSLFSLSPGDVGIRGEQRILPDGTYMTVQNGVPQTICGAGIKFTFTSFCAGETTN